MAAGNDGHGDQQDQQERPVVGEVRLRQEDVVADEERGVGGGDPSEQPDGHGERRAEAGPEATQG